MVAGNEINSILRLEHGFPFDEKSNHLMPLKRNVIPYPVSWFSVLSFQQESTKLKKLFDRNVEEIKFGLSINSLLNLSWI